MYSYPHVLMAHARHAKITPHVGGAGVSLCPHARFEPPTLHPPHDVRTRVAWVAQTLHGDTVKHLRRPSVSGAGH